MLMYYHLFFLKSHDLTAVFFFCEDQCIELGDLTILAVLLHVIAKAEVKH